MDNFQKSIAKYGAYLEELRIRLLRLVKLFVVLFFVGFFSASPVIKFLMNHINLDGVNIVTTSPFQLINLSMSIGFFFACIIITPIFIHQLYLFLRPGLKPREKKFFLLSLPLALLLFIVGFCYGCGMLYYGIKLIANLNVGLGISNYWDISSFLSEIMVTSALLGLLFIFPIVIKFIIRLGIIDVSFLKSKRKHAIVAIFVIVSLLPPTDGLSLVLMALPLILIFELTILFNRGNNGRHLLTN